MAALTTPAATAPSEPRTVATALNYYRQALVVSWDAPESAGDHPVTGYLVQWKSGDQSYDSARQQSTAASARWYRIEGLSNGTEYTVRAFAESDAGRSAPSAETSGIPRSRNDQLRTFIESEILQPYEDAFPWLRQAWDYLRANDIPVVTGWSKPDPGLSSAGGQLHKDCDGIVGYPPVISDLPVDPQTGLHRCRATKLRVTFIDNKHVIVHELAHVYTYDPYVTSVSQRTALAIAHLFLEPLGAPVGIFNCHGPEYFADLMSLDTLGREIVGYPTRYWDGCTIDQQPASARAEAPLLVASAARGEIPAWFDREYGRADGSADLERLWHDVTNVTRTYPVFLEATLVFMLRDSFGGYCDNRKAHDSAFADGPTRNPWRDGGCVPQAPRELAFGADGTDLVLTWSAPAGDGGSPVEGYTVQWKSGSQDFDASRQALVTDLGALTYALGPGSESAGYQVQVSAFNTNGAGAVATVVAAPVTAPIEDDNQGPTMRSAARFEVAENVAAVGTVAAVDADPGDAVHGYTLAGGADAERFAVDAAGALTFIAAPDFESPWDARSTAPANPPGNNEYVVVVAATSGAGRRALTVMQAIVVSVTNVDEDPTGVPAVTGTPRVGETLTAGVGAIADPDGLAARAGGPGYGFQWIRLHGADQRDIANATAQTYTVAAADIGRALRVRVSFTDDGGWRESVVSAPTALVSDALTGGICGRDAGVVAAILRRLATVDSCAQVTAQHLAAIDGLVLTDHGAEVVVESLTRADLAGLPRLRALWISKVSVSGLPADLFADTGRLQELALESLEVEALPAGLFAGLTDLAVLVLGDNGLQQLPAGLFDGLESLTDLNLAANELTALPAGLFEDLVNLENLDILDNLDLAAATIAPTADAGSARTVASGEAVTLAGGASDGGPWGSNVAYSWQQTDAGGSAVELSGADTATPAFVAPGAPAEMTFRLTVRGGGALLKDSHEATATVTVSVVAEAIAAQAAIVTAPGEDGRYATGDRIEVAVRLPDAVTVAGGTPSLAITLDGRARAAAYVSGSGTAALLFVHTVAEADDGARSAQVTSGPIARNGATIRNAANRQVATFGVAPFAAAVAVRREADGNGVWTRGELIEVEVTFSEPVTVDLTAGTPTLAVLAAGDRRLVEYASGSGTTALLFSRALRHLDGELDAVEVVADSLQLNGARVRSASGLDAALGHQAASRAGAPDPERLTARFASLPATHDGTTAFLFRLRFSEAVAIGDLAMRDDVFSVTGGSITSARRVPSPSTVAWDVTVQPAAAGDVVIALRGGRACSEPGAVCTSGGKMLSSRQARVVPGPDLRLSVAGVRAHEGSGASLMFPVTLNRTADATVTVAYATEDGTATAGADYEAAAGILTFTPGATVRTVAVRVYDDTHDEGDETLTLRLSGAHGARIADATAIGTIANHDPLPRAWLARFGRTAAGHVLDAVAGRMNGVPPSQATIAGRRLTAADPTLRDRAAMERRWAARLQRGQVADRPRTMELRGLLAASSFDLATAGGVAGEVHQRSGGRWGLWGRGAWSRFAGEQAGLTMDGAVVSGIAGVDFEQEHVLAGIALAYSSGSGSFDHASGDAGELHGWLLSVHPYLRLRVHERLAVWGLIGYGLSGELELEPAKGAAVSPGLGLLLGALGGHGTLLAAGPGGGFELTAKADALLLRIDSDAVDGLAASSAEVLRSRLLLDAAYRDIPLFGGALSPALEVGVRYDGGDAERGAGLVVGGSLDYRLPAAGLSLSARGQGLLVHRSAGFREWSAGGALRIDPGAPGRGLALSVAPSWGAATVGAQRLWTAPAATVPAPGAALPAGLRRIDAELSYGLALPGERGVFTPYAGLARSAFEPAAWRVGARLAIGSAVGVSLSGSRRQPAGAGAEHTLTLSAALRF